VSINLVIVKTPWSPEGLTDPLELDSDPAFTTTDYQGLAAQLCANVTWQGNAGTAQVAGHDVTLESTDGCLFLNFLQPDVDLDVVMDLTASAAALGVVVMDADNADILPGAAEY